MTTKQCMFFVEGGGGGDVFVIVITVSKLVNFIKDQNVKKIELSWVIHLYLAFFYGPTQ